MAISNMKRKSFASIIVLQQLQCNSEYTQSQPLYKKPKDLQLHISVTSLLPQSALTAAELKLTDIGSNVSLCSLRLLYKSLMELNINAANVPRSAIRYATVSHKGQDYRVVEERYESKKISLLLACLGWTQVILVSLIYVLLEKYNLPNPPTKRYLPLLSQANVFTILMACLVLTHRGSLPPFTTLSAVAGAAYLLTATVLFQQSVAGQWIAAILFSSLEMAIAILFIKVKWAIIPIGLLAAQLIIAALNAESRLSFDWFVALSILVCLVFVAAAAGITLVVLGLIEVCNPNGYRFFALETIYLGMVQFGYAADAATVFLIVAYQIPSTYVMPACAGCNFLVLLFAVYFRTELILYKSKAVILVSQRNKYTFQKIEHKKTFIKNSSNWFNPQCDEKTYLGEQRIRSSIREQTKCVICLTDTAQLVWLPCGHLTVCQTCGQYLMDNGKLQCVMCKTKGEEIWHIRVECQALPQFQSDFYYKVALRND